MTPTDLAVLLAQVRTEAAALAHLDTVDPDALPACIQP